MAEWLEVPAHRIYVICARELRDDFDYIGENGKPVERAEISYRFVRKKDGKVFNTESQPQKIWSQRRLTKFDRSMP